MPTANLVKPESNKSTDTKRFITAPLALYETADTYTAYFELPGTDAGSIDVSWENGILLVRAPLAVELPAAESLKYTEMRLGEYKRAVNFGDKVDFEKIEATFTGGLLKLVIPKSKATSVKKIVIRTV